jgi:uncharacterized membrane-anchored protein
MLALGLILLIVACGAVLAALLGAEPGRASFDLGAFTLEMSTVGVFLFGAVTVLLLTLGLELLRVGFRRARRRRQERRELSRLQKREALEPASPSTNAATAASTAGSTRGTGRDPDTGVSPDSESAGTGPSGAAPAHPDTAGRPDDAPPAHRG